MSNPWLIHLKKYHSQHPSLTYKEAMKEAKKTYTPKSGSKKSGTKSGSGMCRANIPACTGKKDNHGGKSVMKLPAASYTPGSLVKKSRKHGGNPAALAVAGQALGVGNNLITSISSGVQKRLDSNGFYNRERLRNDRKELNKLIMDLYVEAHRRGEKNYTREDAEKEAYRLARLSGLAV